MRSPKGKNKPAAQSPKGGELAFKYLPEDQSNSFLQISSAPELEKSVASFLKIVNSETDIKNGILIDYYFSVIWYSKELQMNAAQLSSAYSAAHILLDNIKEKNSSMAENLLELKAMFAGIGVEEAEISGGLEHLTPELSKQLMDYLQITIFQHYHLYQFLFHNTPSEEILGTDLLIETAPLPDIPFPPPLAEGITIDLYNKYVVKATQAVAQTPAQAPAAASVNPESTQMSKASEATATTSPTSRPQSSRKEKDSTTNSTDKMTPDEIFAELSPEQVSSVVDEVCKEMLTGLELDMVNKIRDKENNFITRINKIHKVAE